MSFSDGLKKLAGIVGKAAPLLGTVLGGPAAVAMPVVSMIASAFGVETTEPDELAGIISADPAAAARLKEVQSNNEVKLQQIAADIAITEMQEQTKQIQAVNTTMQSESKSEHWMQWSWRPFNGFMFGITLFMNYGFPMIVNMFIRAFGEIGSDGTYSLLTPGAIPEWVFVAWGSVLGVTSWHRGKQKRIAAGEDKAPSLLQKIASLKN